VGENVMWNKEYVLDVASKKTGLSPEEIRKTSWDDLEDKLGVERVNIHKRREGYLISPDLKRILTKKKYADRERNCLEFIESFYALSQ